MQHLLKMSMELEKSQETYSIENQWQTKNCEAFSCLKQPKYGPSALKTSMLFAQALHVFYCQATKIFAFSLPLVCA